PFDTQHVIDKVKRVLSQPRAAAAARPAAQAPAAARSPNKTMAFERPAAQPAAPPPAPPGRAPAAAPPAAKPAPAAAMPMAAAIASATGGDLARKLDGLGLTADQVQGVLALSRDVIERVVWEVVPDLAETLIREEIKRLTQ